MTLENKVLDSVSEKVWYTVTTFTEKRISDFVICDIRNNMFHNVFTPINIFIWEVREKLRKYEFKS